ncbi:hypothetical protein [Pseudomonas abietaniphila]|uniref:hypothetical protein n=1 Tax=Pseudomonas abietaniphila TaxID=89065 RepID=UPI0007850467|nr:hypothetical protein [Pseudomonas abietaniphila]
MNLHVTANRHGILSGSTSIAPHALPGCRATLHNGTLFCVYRADTFGRVQIIKQAPGETWQSPEPQSRMSAIELPTLVSFNDTLYLFYKAANEVTYVCSYDERLGKFKQIDQLNVVITETPSFAVLNGVLHMFYKRPTGKNIYYRRTTNVQEWAEQPVIKRDGVNTAVTELSPVAITYQNLIHLIYQDDVSGESLLQKTDGGAWSGPLRLVTKPYEHSPGIAVHNGLLTLIYTDASQVLHQYSYDGHSISPLVPSASLKCDTASPALAVQDGFLTALYTGPA